ncbi:MAG: thioredoxin domain-containing protein [Dehalococcoidia bacterium]|nr:thioredoxin domain-containing protein [Dehalococcoidia bacterium]
MANKKKQQAKQPNKRQSRLTPDSSRKTQVGIVAAVVVVLVGVVILALSITGAGGGAPPAAGGPGDSSVKGSLDAKVTVEEYSDFQCPYCARFALDTFPKIDQNYVKTGKVRWVFRHLARIGPESVAAAQAAECAGEQEQFWPYHDKLFASQQGENRGGFSSSRLKSFAKEMGMDANRFDSCLDSGRWASKVNQELAEGQRRGVRGTPSFFIGKKMVEGAEAYSVFEAAIEEALRQ